MINSTMASDSITTISLDDPRDIIVNLTNDTTFDYVDYKFDEDKYLKELRDYIDSTYQGHYATTQFQSTEVIIARGHGTGFCMGNVDKYANRYGKKGTKEDARKDLLKVIHYALLQLHVHDSEEEE